VIFGLDAFAPYAAAVILILLFVSFLYEVRSPEVSALGAAAVMLLIGLISADDLVESLSNSAPVTIGAMFIISASLVRTGVVEWIAAKIIADADKRPGLSVLLFLSAIAAVSAVMNNTPLVMMMIPIAVALAAKLRETGSRLLIPVSYAAVLGGMITMIGTSTNIVADGVARAKGLEPFHILEVAPLGIPIAIIGVLFVAATRRLLPERISTASLLGQKDAARYITEVVIEDTSPYIGQRPLEVKAFNTGERRVIDVVRGDASLRREFADVVLMEGDIVVMRTPIADILTMKELGEMKTPTEERAAEEGLQPISTRKSIVVEILLAPGAHFIGRTLRHLRLRRRYGVYPIALHRRSANIADRFETTRLEVGDTLLIEGAPEDLKRLVDDNDLVNVAEPQARPMRVRHAPIAVSALLFVIVGATLEAMPIAALSVIGAAAVLATRCIEPDEAFEAVDWRVLSLILAMLAIGTGVDNSGLVEIMVSAAGGALQNAPPIFALAAVYVVGLVLTEIMSNNAVAVVLTPVAIALAHALGVDPRPFVVAVMFSASLAFATPIGYQTNTLIYSVGGYKFADYARLGAPLNAITAIIAILLIPMIWPF
jgi:di/tricarboxylate transporter